MTFDPAWCVADCCQTCLIILGYSSRPSAGPGAAGSGSNMQNMRQVRETRESRQAVQGQSGGVLKLNVAIAGEFSMGNFGNNQNQH